LEVGGALRFRLEARFNVGIRKYWNDGTGLVKEEKNKRTAGDFNGVRGFGKPRPYIIQAP
jgi:hypothetical protein